LHISRHPTPEDRSVHEHHQPGSPPRGPEIPVPDDPQGPIEPGPPDSPPQPDPPDVVASGYGVEEHFFNAERWQPACWRPHAGSSDSLGELG
jgi:hypothetical protein